MLRNVLLRLGLAPLFLLIVAAFNVSADVLFYDFSSQPPGTRILDPTPAGRPNPRIEDGVLKLTDAFDPGNFAGFAIGPFPTVNIQALQATWKSRLGGGGGGGADGYSLSIGTDLADNFQGEEGTGTGLIVAIDTFDNGVALDPAGTGLEIKWGGTILSSTHVNKDNAGDGIYLRKDAFVDACVTVSPSGFVAFVYDGVTLTAQIPGFAGISANQYIFGARTGGANDNQWIDDLRIVTQTPGIIITPTYTNGIWRYNQSNNLESVNWSDLSYDDTQPGWQEGEGLFSNDTGNGNIGPIIRTPVNGPRVPAEDGAVQHAYYFRHKFNYDGPIGPGTLLNIVARLDDAVIWYMNGHELLRVRMPDGPLEYTTRGTGQNLTFEGDYDEFFAIDVGSVLVQGENVVGARMAQVGGDSSDVTFGAGLSITPGLPPTIVNHLFPSNTTVFANRPVSFSAEAIGSPAVTWQWYKDGVAIDPALNATATTSTLVLSNAQAGDEGSYFARAMNALGSTDSRTATLTVLPANPLKVVRAQGSLDLKHVTVVYDQFVDPQSAIDPFNYAVAGFGLDPMIPPVLNPDGSSVTLTLDAAQSPATSYCVTISGVLSGAQLGLDPDPTTVCYQTFVVSCGFAVQENFNGIGGVLLSDLFASPKWPGAPDLVRYRSFAGINTADEFDNYGTRLSGFVIPPVSGNYTFYFAADDQGDLWLSTDSSPANLVNIANEPVWSGRRTWTGEAGGGGRAGVTSHGGPQANISAPIPLVAGQMYYFEARMKEGGGGDNLDIAWQKPGDPVPLNGSPSIPGVYLASLADPVNASLTVNTQPQDQRIVLNPGGGGARALLDQNFNAGDGGFTVETPQDFPTPWTYNAAAGSWQVNQEGPEEGHPMTSRLRSAPITVTRDGLLQLSFNHRWSMEQGNWDGGQVRVSLNGGPFTAVSGGAFTSGGYNGSVLGNSASVLSGQTAFVLDSPGHQTPSFVNSVARLGFFLAGDVVQIEFLYAGDTNTRGNYQPSWEVNDLVLTEGIAAQQPARFTVSASAVVGGSPSSSIFYQWERDCGSGYALIPGANAAVYSFEPRLADNGCKFRVRMYVPGATALSSEATLTVVQPNTPPSFTCGPAPAPVECGGAGQVTVPNWATDIQVHSITRTPTSFSTDFSSLPAGTRLLDPNAASARPDPRVEDGVLKLTDANDPGGFGGWAVGPFTQQTFESIQASWKSKIGGGGGGGADGYSLNIGNDLVDSFTGEEGTGTGLSVTVDTFDNGGGEVGIEIKFGPPDHSSAVGAASVAFVPIPKDDPGDGRFLRKGVYVDASLEVAAGGQATFTYDGNVVSVQLPNYAGIRANQISFGARTGGANDDHWIDDFSITGFPFDASSAEVGQTVHFNVSNTNPSLFSAQPAVSPNGTLTYTLAPGAVGSADVTVVAQDSGGTADGGRDTSAPCNFTVSVGDTTPPSITCPANITATADASGSAVVTWVLEASDTCGLASRGCTPMRGSSFPVGTHTVSCTATDVGGNSATCSFTVTVLPGTLPPNAVIHSDQLIDLKPEYDQPVLLSCNWWNACLVADGWTSSDPEGGDLTYLWNLAGDPVPFGAGPVVTNCLEVGQHTIILTVTDPTGLSDTDSLTIEIVTAPLAIELLIEQVDTAHKHGVLISRKLKRELIATLRVALGHAGDEELRATQKALDAFEKKVRANVAEIGEEAATAWIRWSQAVSEGMEKCIKPPRKPKSDDPKDPDPKKR